MSAKDKVSKHFLDDNGELSPLRAVITYLEALLEEFNECFDEIEEEHGRLINTLKALQEYHCGGLCQECVALVLDKAPKKPLGSDGIQCQRCGGRINVWNDEPVYVTQDSGEFPKRTCELCLQKRKAILESEVERLWAEKQEAEKKLLAHQYGSECLKTVVLYEVAELRKALKALQEHHCGGLCPEGHDEVMAMVNEALGGGIGCA